MTDPKERANALRAVQGLTVRVDERLSAHTSFRLGGPADLWLEPSTVEALCRAIPLLEDLPWMPLGAGTNVLFDDRGFRGAVISTRALLGVSVSSDTVVAKAGTPLRAVVRAAVDAGLAGLEGLWGIPGTVGGAIVGNAGAFGQASCDRLVAVDVVSPDGTPRRLERASLTPGYRRGGIPARHVVSAAIWRLDQGDPARLKETMAECTRRRSASQPWDLPSAGCVFRNPPGDSAGRLIDAAGLKGLRVGGAMVSPVHANFIVVVGPSSAREVRQLIRLVQERVRDASGILLEPELVIVGAES